MTYPQFELLALTGRLTNAVQRHFSPLFNSQRLHFYYLVQYLGAQLVDLDYFFDVFKWVLKDPDCQLERAFYRHAWLDEECVLENLFLPEPLLMLSLKYDRDLEEEFALNFCHLTEDDTPFGCTHNIE